MRPQQQNRRMRGRNNNNNSNNNNNRGKGNQNPLTRSYESNGPDVKIRGNAQQIAEKYSTLARDAMSAGDRVMAENYLQHAEHYNRIIAAAQAQMPIQQVQQNRDDFDDEDGDDFDGQTTDGVEAGDGSGPQPVIDGVPAEVALNGENGGENQGRGNDHRRDGSRNRDGRNRDGRDRNRDFQGRNNGNGDYQRRDRRDDALRQDNSTEAVADADVSDSLPAFLTAGVQPATAETAVPEPVREDAPRRSRRPRRGERASEETAPEGEHAEAQAGGEVFAASDE